ncbi:MAG TPA: aminotransferase class V-fold PLP-dependent enzyme, partial [Planctomycetia bacterium]|nr:aminotransferase class V-fold PLP-dependent enzyme [Planctomycetia bacterium]
VELCASGTAAVELSLAALKVGPGTEVILAAYDFRGNMANVLARGATPVLVDVDPVTGQMDATKVNAALTNKTAAVTVSHLHGGMADVAAVKEAIGASGAKLIEDICQMPGAQWNGEIAGTNADVVVWSFGGSKLLTAGRGGAVLLKDAAAAERLRVHSFRGNDAYPLSELQAAALEPQVATLEQDHRQRADSAKKLFAAAEQVAWLTPFVAGAAADPGYFKLGFWFDGAGAAGLTRGQLTAALQAEGFPAFAGFRSLHRSFARSRFQAAGELSQATRLHERCVVLHHTVLYGDEGRAEKLAAALAKIEAHAVRIAAEVASPLSEREGGA